MNNKTMLTIAVLLAFAAGFASSQILISPNTINIVVINDRDYYPVVIEKN